MEPEAEHRKIEGRWWVAAHADEAVFGTLESSSNKLELIVKIPLDLTVNEAMSQSFDTAHEVPNVIHGRNSHNQPVTLFGCFCAPQIREGLLSLRIDAIAAIEGLEIAEWTTPVAQTVIVDLEPIGIWLGRHALSTKKRAGEKESAYAPSPVVDLTFKLPDGTEFGIWSSTASESRQESVSFAQQSSVWLQFDQQRSLKDISENWVPWLDRLFSLLIGSPVRHRSVFCYTEKYFGDDSRPSAPKGELLREGGRPPTKAHEIGYHEMITRYPECSRDFDTIIQRWANVSVHYQPVIDLFAVAAFNRSLHSEAEFLFLVQALEVYHARSPDFQSVAVPTKAHKLRVERAVAGAPPDLQDWVLKTLRAANYKPLDERLSDIFTHHHPETELIFGTVAELPERIRYTRNHLTHHTGKETSPKLLTPNELTEVSWNLRTLIWVCMLREIGVSGAPIERLIRKYRARFVTL